MGESNASFTAAGRRPTGFWMDLPEGWISIDVDPSTSPAALRQVLDSAEQADGDIREHRAQIEQLFGQVVADAAQAGVKSCACLFTVVDDVLPVQASVTIAVRSIEGEGFDVAGMFRELSEGETARRVDVAELDAGAAVRRSGRRRHMLPGSEELVDMVSRQFYVPVPNAPGELALLTFSTPTVALEAELCDLFDSMAATFVFTFDG
ncbi:MAG: hypothetical protein ACRD0K_26770 [Egibacteraceae bacterium]